MTGDEMLEALESAEAGLSPSGNEAASEASAARERYFVFSVGKAYYALPPSAVREIASDLEVFPLPACPPYIPGLVNNHGTPCTVFDLMLFFENERQPVRQFLVLNLADDAVAFGCTEAVEIVQVPVADISGFSDKDESSRYFTALFPFDGQRVPVLSVREILGKLERDLA